MSVRLEALVLAVACAGCFSVSTSEVQVHDATQVALETPKGEPLLPAGASEAIVDRGKYWYLLSKEPYEVRAHREPNGAISVRCDACDAPYPLSGTPRLELLAETGRSRPTLSWSVDIGASRVAVSYEGSACMLYGRHTCDVPVRARLVVPTSDVVEVRRRVEPVRIWGYMLLGVAVLAVGAATGWALTPSHGDSIGERAPWAAVGALPFAVAGGIGLWQILSPAKEQVWRPNAASGQ
jgi:hypothetical protein